MSSYSVVYTTVDTEKSAKEIAEHLISKKLAACVNMHSSATSFYMWEGKLRKDKEIVILIKTRASLVDDVMVEIKHIHPYDTPALYSFSIDKGDEKYMNWVDMQLL